MMSSCSCALVAKKWIVLFFFNDTATTEIYTLSLHDALPIFRRPPQRRHGGRRRRLAGSHAGARPEARGRGGRREAPLPGRRSEEHTSELQSRQYLVCRLLLAKKKKHAAPSSPLTLLCSCTCR